MQVDLLGNLETEKTPTLSPKRLRIAAALIDLVIIWAIGFMVGLLFGQTYTSSSGSFGYELTGLPALIAMACWFLVMPVNEGLTGQTIGKRILKIKVVKKDGSDITLLISIVRHFFDVIDCILLIGLIVASTNKNNQRIGDLVANTIVIKKMIEE